MSERTILYIAPQIPYPLNLGVKIRQFNILSAYAKVGKVRLVFFYKNEEELAGLEALKPFCSSFHPVPFQTTYGQSVFFKSSLWKRRLGQTLTRKPLLSRIYFSHQMQKVIEKIAPSANLIHVARLHMVSHVAPLFRKRSACQRFILDLDDIETKFKKRLLKTQKVSLKRKAFEYFDLFRLLLHQKMALRRFDRVLVCSNLDRAYINSRKVVVIPNGANLPLRVLPDESDSRTLLYIGALSYGPNIDGFFFFLKEIFPHIQKAVPGVRLLVVGKDPAPEVSNLHDGKTVFVEGNVPSVEKYYRQATVSIVPLRVGAGTRLRILESFAFGRPVVSTSVGCEGLEVVNRETLSVADDPHEFAKSCINLLKNPQLRARLVSNARKLVECNYTWDSIQSRVGTLAKQLLRDFS